MRDVLVPVAVGAAVTAGALALGGYAGITVRVLQLADHVFVALLRAILS
jgi:hypothetical protein